MLKRPRQEKYAVAHQVLFQVVRGAAAIGFAAVLDGLLISGSTGESAPETAV